MSICLSVFATVAVVVNSELLDRVSRELIERAGTGRITKDAFRASAPFLSRQIEMDAGSPLLDYWGLSLNFDENVKAAIVHPKILTAIGSLCRRRMRFGRAYHAGLIHTYGYLLSTLETPYGFKRDRWIEPDIEHGLKLPPHTLRAEPGAGTLLQNLTYFLGRIVFRHSASQLRKLEMAAAEVAPNLRTYAYPTLDISRIIEACTVTAGTKRRVSLFTDLVRYRPRTARARSSSALLVYSLTDPQQGGTRLLTAFNIGPETVAELAADEAFGPRVGIRPRYNAYIPGFNGELPGTRRLA